jgi:Tfp pilus assembly protein PilN
MIQINLLPDVKVAYIKARAQKRMVVVVSTIIACAALAIFILLFSYVHGVQSKSISDLTNDIKKNSDELTSTKDLNKILTVQNQLLSLEGLHNQKPALDRLPNYIAITTPANVTLSSFDMDFSTKAISISGTANNLSTINAYVDTLKSTYYKTSDNPDASVKAFSQEVLGSFSLGDESASFSISLVFDGVIFDSLKEVELFVQGARGGQLNTDAFGNEGGV